MMPATKALSRLITLFTSPQTRLLACQPGCFTNLPRLCQPCESDRNIEVTGSTADTAVAHSVFGWDAIKFLLKNTLRRVLVRL